MTIEELREACKEQPKTYILIDTLTFEGIDAVIDYCEKRGCDFGAVGYDQKTFTMALVTKGGRIDPGLVMRTVLREDDRKDVEIV
jgi:hypothetical protein